MRSRVPLAGLALVALLAVACGQYPGVHERGLLTGETSALGGGESQGAAGADVGVAGGGPAGDDGAGASGAGETGGGGAGGGGGSGASSAGGSTTVGVTDTTITVGVHAPLTGAAPLKAESFNVGKDLYWRYGNGGRSVRIHGRTVRVVFRDDQYNPSHARQMCEEMIERDRAFLLIGGGGTDQIQACAQFSARQGIPYLSAGVTEIGMRQLDNYFALSMSYAQQAPLVAQYIRNSLRVRDPSRVVMIATNTPNFDDAVQAFQKAYPNARVFRPDKNERGSSMAASLCVGTMARFDAVFPLVAPTYYLEMAKAAKCHPQYVGVGITMGLDQVASTGCEGDRATENARFLSPAPAFEDARQGKWDPQFVRAAQTAGVNPDDIMWLFWGLSRTLHQLFERAGEALSREGFISSTERASVETGVYPPLRYRPDDHFGADSAHLLRNVCRSRGSQAGYYVTEKAFAKSF